MKKNYPPKSREINNVIDHSDAVRFQPEPVGRRQRSSCKNDTAINSKEQMFTEKLRSLLKFGPNSTRYKDIFDMVYLSGKISN